MIRICDYRRLAGSSGLRAVAILAGCLIVSACKSPAATGPLPPKIQMDCTIAQFAPIAPGPPLTATAALAGGSFLVPGFELPNNVLLNLTQDLVVVANDDIVIAGFMMPAPRKVGAPSINILLISLHGNILIWQNGLVGDDNAADGETIVDNGPWAFASSGHGAHGGWVKLVAAEGSIEIDGRVRGNGGGAGGFANADASIAVNPALSAFLWLPWLGSADAVGGDAGDGGDVILCARESIHFGAPAPPAAGRAIGGTGGAGGQARAASENWAASARAGSQTRGRGTGGSVYIDHVGAQPVQVFVDAFAGIYGGDSRQPNSATALGASRGAVASAEGGPGAPGGEVKFGQAVVWNRGTIQSGNGGNGGDADTLGGKGVQGAANANGQPGGDATARAGQGAPPGLIPTYLDGTSTPWQMALGKVGKRGSGGVALAIGGAGGNAGPGGVLGGPSGKGSAFGGKNAAGAAPGVPPGAPAETGPNPAQNNQGAAGTKATQNGKP